MSTRIGSEAGAPAPALETEDWISTASPVDRNGEEPFEQRAFLAGQLAGGNRQAQAGEPIEQRGGGDAHLSTSEVRADAEVRAEAEREVGVGVGSGDVEAVRVGVHRLDLVR